MIKRRFIRRFLISLLSLMFILLVIDFINYFNFNKAISKIDYLPSYELVSVRIYGNSTGSISGIVNIRDTDNHSIAEIERSWTADNLYLDFIQIKINDGYLFLPFKLYSNKFLAGKSGLKLSRYYLKNNKCLLFGTNVLTDTKALFKVCSYATHSSFFKFNTGAKIVTLDLSQCISGKEYSVIPDNKGNLIFFSIDD